MNSSRGLITDERYQELPSPCMVERFGATKARTIALTFDDGPDPKYTPFILDILRRKHVPATFFIVGTNGQRYPELIERELDDSTKSAITPTRIRRCSAISTAQLRLEVSGTERLLQAATDRQAVLFRAPYGSDIDPSTMEDTKPLEIVTDMGYISVGWNIDPEDWKQPRCRRDRAPRDQRRPKKRTPHRLVARCGRRPKSNGQGAAGPHRSAPRARLRVGERVPLDGPIARRRDAAACRATKK